MSRRVMSASVAVCVVVLALGGWVVADPPGALRTVLLACLEVRGVERRVWRTTRASGEYFEAGAGNERAIVLLHGAGGDALSSWFSLMPALARDYHVLAPQMAYAHMDSMRNDREHPLRLDHGGPDRIGQELNGIQEAMRAAGVDRATLVGLSVGSWLGLRMAAWRPEQVEGVVAVAPAGPNLRGLAERIEASGIEPGKWFYDNLFHNAAPVPEVFLRGHYPVIASWVRNLHWYVDLIERGGLGAELYLRRVRCPVALVWGREDSVLPVEGRAYYEANLRDVSVQVLDECGHAVVWDRPEALERIVRRFMKPGNG